MLVLNEWGAFVRAFLKCKIRSSSVSAARTSVQKHLKNTGGNRDTHATGRDENTVTSDREYFGTSGVHTCWIVGCRGHGRGPGVFFAQV
jgi:hypothetical protein